MFGGTHQALKELDPRPLSRPELCDLITDLERLRSRVDERLMAAKAALDSLARSQAARFGPSGVRVNAVAPGLIITEMWAAGREIPGLADGLEKHIPLGRWGVPEEIASVVGFLAGDDARYITGQTIIVDGGFWGPGSWASYM